MKYTPKTFFIKVIKYLKWHLLDKNIAKIKRSFKRKIKNEIRKVLETVNDYKRIIIWLNNDFAGWNVELFQRPQHIARSMASKDVLYFYNTVLINDKVSIIRRYKDNLYLVNAWYFNILIEVIETIEKPKYLHIYSTEKNLPLNKVKAIQKKGFYVLYEYIDDLSPAILKTNELPKNIEDKYKYCLQDRKKTAVVVTADNIEKDVLRYRSTDEFAYSCNGVDYEHFQVKANIELLNESMREIIEQGKPIIGYYGALAVWFDYDMIRKLATERPQYNIVLIGVKYDTYHDKDVLEKFENIHFLGSVDYNILPYYAIHFDVCTIPFIVNDITEATSPLKLFEYMALHKPIVTTGMHECKKYDSVFIANNSDQYIALIDKCLNLNEQDNKDYFDLLDREAKDNMWGSKAEIILNYLERFEAISIEH